ncbi:uncharacterized protein RCC_07511 [Ramularia collo-cygni]|uniref:Uncharacterized protein n=1 Tax=Ramularia collo-cygni TaxID=112498 RepID=A0A2D3VCZ8_9PEZI|nr:uncharacterized protein RCC_07511 [Ramularia collo-cygni]CZT21646.1 uncharacterized protein RCC_07511 [Ramularia collo-cygni]
MPTTTQHHHVIIPQDENAESHIINGNIPLRSSPGTPLSTLHHPLPRKNHKKKPLIRPHTLPSPLAVSLPTLRLTAHIGLLLQQQQQQHTFQEEDFLQEIKSLVKIKGALNEQIRAVGGFQNLAVGGLAAQREIFSDMRLPGWGLEVKG